MQSLGAFNVDDSLLPRWGFGNTYSSSVETKRRSNRKRVVNKMTKHNGSSCCFLMSLGELRFCSSEFCGGCSKLNLGLRFLSGCCSLSLGYHPRCSYGRPFALARGLEQQAVGSEFGKENMVRVGGLFGISDDEAVGSMMDPHSSDGDVEGESKDEVCEQTEGRISGEKSERLDVRALALSLWSATTADDVEEVLKDKGELPLQVFSSMIRGFGRDCKLESAIAVVEWLKRKKNETNGLLYPNLFIYNSLLGAIKQSEQFEMLDKILKDMAEEGISPNVVTYNTLMVIYLEQGRTSDALNVLEKIQEAGLIPSPVSYSTALLAYRRMEDGFGALRFFIELREKYLNGEIGRDSDEDWPNEFEKLENFTIRICYQVMRRWLIRQESLSKNVIQLLTDMDNVGIRPSRQEYERLVWACTREEHYVVVKELYTRIRERHSDISLSVCNHVIWLMGKAKKWWAALEVYEDLLDKGPKPNNMSYELIVSHFNILLSAARKKGIWRWGIRLLDKMEDKGLKPGSREWNAVLIACSKASEANAAVEIFKRMVEQGEKPTIISYGALLSVLEKGKLYDEAHRVWDHMIKVGVEPNVYAYTIMASILIGEGKFNLVDALIREMISTGNDPTVVTYNAIISGCARNGMGSVAYEWFHRMKVQNIPPNEVTYEMLIEALAKDGKPKLAYELYLRAHNEGLMLSNKAYDAVVRSSQVYSATVDLSILGSWPLDKKMTP